MAEHSKVLEERIRVRAYYLWLDSNYPPALEHDFWYRAEMRERARARLESLISSVSEGAAYSHAFNLDVEPSADRKGMSCTRLSDENTGVDFVRLANGSATAFAGGKTNGYSIRVPDALEIAASGKNVAVDVVARAAEAAGSRFAIAYSTNEVGNSGWRWSDAGSEWSTFGMKFQVPPMKSGNGDFVGLLADVEGRPGVDICAMSVRVF